MPRAEIFCKKTSSLAIIARLIFKKGKKGFWLHTCYRTVRRASFLKCQSQIERWLCENLQQKQQNRIFKQIYPMNIRFSLQLLFISQSPFLFQKALYFVYHNHTPFLLFLLKNVRLQGEKSLAGCKVKVDSNMRNVVTFLSLHRLKMHEGEPVSVTIFFAIT